ncbi:MAG: hypothetical protein OXH76_16535 [Boseongicola sp.]|nr:hypothetical protein [Boseongicola sp.]
MTSKMKVSGQSPARTKMIEVMAMKGLAQRTQENYLASVCSLARHWGRAPQALSADEVGSIPTKVREATFLRADP